MDCKTLEGLDLNCLVDDWAPVSEHRCLIPQNCTEVKNNLKSSETWKIWFIVTLALALAIFGLICYVKKKITPCKDKNYAEIQLD